MEQQKDQLFVFKFAIYVSRVSVAASFQTDLRVSWRSQLALGSAPPITSPLKNGEAQLNTQLLMEEILQLDAVTRQFRSKESFIFVEFVNNGEARRAGLCRVDLAALATEYEINNVTTHQLTDCFDQEARISFALTQISSFEIDQAEVASFTTLSRDGSQRIITEGDAELPPMFGARENRHMNNQGLPSQKYYSQQQFGDQSAPKSGHRLPKKSPSPGARSNTARQHAEEYEKFMRLIESKDELIHQLQLKVEELLQSKKALQVRCTSLEQQLKSVQLDYKALIAARDAAKEAIKEVPQLKESIPFRVDKQINRIIPHSKARGSHQAFESEIFTPRRPFTSFAGRFPETSKAQVPAGRFGETEQKMSPQFLRKDVPREEIYEEENDGLSGKLTESREIRPPIRERDEAVQEFDKVVLHRKMREHTIELEGELRYLKDELEKKVDELHRKADSEKRQNELIQHLTDKLMAKASEQTAKGNTQVQSEMHDSLVGHLQKFQEAQRMEIEALKKSVQDPTVSMRQYEKLRRETETQLDEMKEALFAEKKKNILLEEQNNRLKADIKRMDQELKAVSGAAKRNQHSKNEELQLQEQYIEQKNKQLRNELQELKKNAMTAEKNPMKVSSINEERYKVMEEELKLKISTMREELDQKHLEFKNSMHEKQVEITSLKDQLHIATNQKTSLEKKVETLTSAIANEKEKTSANEKKALSYDRLEKRLKELEKFNAEVKQDYQKAEADKKLKSNEVNDLKLKLQERDIQWTRLKRLEGDYKNLQDTHSKLSQIKQKNDRRLEDMERKTLKLKETLLLSGRGSLTEERLMKQLQDKIKDKGKSEEITQLQNQRRQLKEQSERLNSKVKELEQEISKGRESQMAVSQLEEEKTKIKKQLSIQVETKLRAIETRLQTKRHSEMNDFANMTKSRDSFEQARMKMLERENEQIRNLTKELTKKLLDMERLNIERVDHSDVEYKLKKKKKELLDNEQDFEKEINDALDSDASKSNISQPEDNQKGPSQNELKKSKQKDHRMTTRDHVQKLRQAYLKRIEYLKSELTNYQKREVDLFEKEKELQIRETRVNASEESKKLLKLYEAHNLEIKYLKEKAQRLEQIEPEYLELKQKADKFDAMKNSLIVKKSEQEENIKQELQKRHEQNRNKLHKMTLEMQDLKFQKDSEKTEYETQIRELKKTLADSRDGFEKLKKVSRQQINALTEQVKRNEEQMTAFRDTYQSNTAILVEEVEKRDQTIRQQTGEIEYLTKKLDEASKLFHDNLSICAEQQNKLKVITEQNGELRQIVLFREQENAELMGGIDSLQQQLTQVMQEQQAKYEELDSNNKDEISLLHIEINRLHTVLEDEMDKFLRQQEQILFMKGEIMKYETSIEELYTEALNNEETMKNLKAAEAEHKQEQKIVEEEYEKLLHEFGQKNIQISQLKNDYLTLQGLLTTSEAFIKKQEEIIEANKQQYQDVVDTVEEQKQHLMAQLEEMKNAAEIKQHEFLDYNKKMNDREREYQGCIEELKFEYEKQKLTLEEAKHALSELDEENSKLRDEVEVLKEFKKDNEKRKGKRGTEPELKEDKSLRKIPAKQEKEDSEKERRAEDMTRSPMFKQQSSGWLAPPPESSRIHQSPSSVTSNRHDSLKSEGVSREESHLDPMSMSPPPAIRVLSAAHDEERADSPNQGYQQREFEEEEPKQQLLQEQERPDLFLTKRHSPPHIPQTSQQPKPSERLDTLQINEGNSQIREETHDSGEDSERDSYRQLSNQLKSAEQRIGEIQRQLMMKASAVQDLEIDNSKLKDLLQQKISKRARIGPDGRISQGSPDDLDEEDQRILSQMKNLKDKISELKDELTKANSEKERYAGTIGQINQQYQQLSMERDDLEEQYKEKKKQLQAAQEKELEYLEDQRVGGEIIEEKERLIAEFEEMLKGYQQDKENAEKMMADLQHEYDQKLISQKELKQQVAKLEEALTIATENVSQLRAQLNDLEGKLESVTCEFTSCRSTKATEVDTLQHQLLSVRSQVKDKELKIHEIAQKYVSLEDGLSKEAEEVKKLQLKLQERNHKYEQSLLKISSLEKEVNLGVLLRKDLESRIADVLRENKSKDSEKNRLNNQLLAELKRMEQEKENLHQQISNRDSAIEQKDLECYALKKDIEVFNMETRKLRKDNEEKSLELRVYEEQTKQMLRHYETEMQNSRDSDKLLETRVRELEQIIVQHEESAEQLQKIDRIRQDMVHEVERKYKLLEEEHRGQNDKLTADFNAQMAAAIRELNDRYTAQSSRQNAELTFTKNLCDQMKFEMEQERANLFDRECEYEREKHEFKEERSLFEDKIRRYEHEVRDLVEKFRRIEKDRPTVELYEELAFQNEIFKNRIAELEHSASFKQQIGENEVYEQFEYFKIQKQREREEFLAELDNYSNQVNELEEKNYLLNKELQSIKSMDFGRMHELEEENLQLEKEVIRLEHSQEELSNQLRMLKNKREEDLKRHYSEIRLLKSK